MTNLPTVQSAFDMTLEEIRVSVEPYKDQIENSNNLHDIKTALERVVKIRTQITSAGRKGREVSNAFNKSVISFEKKLLEEVSPVELLAKSKLERLQKEENIKRNALKLPDRLSALNRLGLLMEPDAINQLSDDEFHRILEKEIYERNAREKYQVAVEEAAAKKIQQEQDDLQAVARKAEYAQWLKDNAYDKATDILQKENGSIALYRRVSTF